MAAMAWTITDDVHEFLAAAGDWLRTSTAENTLMLTVAEACRLGSAPAPADVPEAFGWWTDEHGLVVGACMQTPPFPLLISATPPGAPAALAARLADAAHPPSQLSGDQPAVEAFGREWLALHPGATSEVAWRQRLYRLGALAWPSAPGEARPATAADRDLLVAWREAFQADIGERNHSDTARAVDSVLSYGGWTLWTVDGAPVSMCSLTRQVAGMVRVGAVYTPPEHRRHGYAAAVVATVSQRAREAGATEIVLFTDLDNPTSNSVYQRIGYRPVRDSIVLELVPSSDHRM